MLYFNFTHQNFSIMNSSRIECSTIPMSDLKTFSAIEVVSLNVAVLFNSESTRKKTLNR